MGYRKDFLPGHQRFALILVFMNCSGHEVRRYVTYKHFLQLTHVESCIDCISRTLFDAFLSFPLSPSFSTRLFILNFAEARRKKYHKLYMKGAMCFLFLLLVSGVIIFLKKLSRNGNAKFFHVEMVFPTIRLSRDLCRFAHTDRHAWFIQIHSPCASFEKFITARTRY